MTSNLVLSKNLNRLQSITRQFKPIQTRAARHISNKSTMAAETQFKAPWRDLLSSHLKQTPGYEFTIATVGHDENHRPVPRVRTCGCRGFFPELEIHPKSQVEMREQVKDGGNPATYESDMLCFTTDIRMEKLDQLENSGHAIEAIFWLKDLMTQWRIKGKAFAIGDPREEMFEGEKMSREELGSSLRVKDNQEGSVADWTWERAVTKYFANHSPIARGSFKNPAPGLPRSQIPESPALRMGQKVTDLHDPVARENFRVVIIRPEEVERLDLSNQEDMRRWKWTLDSGDHKGNQSAWIETEVWP